MARTRRGSPGTPGPPAGSTAVRAVVVARLLGIRLLELDARVVVGPAPRSRALPALDGDAGADLALAMQLLDDSGRTLERARRS